MLRESNRGRAEPGREGHHRYSHRHGEERGQLARSDPSVGTSVILGARATVGITYVWRGGSDIRAPLSLSLEAVTPRMA
jgi:hypothetical protein